MKTKILCLTILLFIIFPAAVSAGTIAMGQKCDSNADCISNDCEDSDIEIEKDDFCVCSTAKHCEDKYNTQAGETWECKDGTKMTHELHFCESNIGGTIKQINPIDSPENITAEAEKDKADKAAAETSAKQIDTTPPVMQVKIPGLKEWKSEKITPGQDTNISWLAEYITAVYSYMIVIGAIFAVIMLMVGGILYLTAGGTPVNVGTANKIMIGSVTGLVVLLASHLILQTINPNLTKLTALSIESVPDLTFQESIDAVYGGTPADAPITPSGASVTPGTPGKWRSQMLDKSVCGNIDNLNLSPDQRNQKLKQILQVWKKIGVDEGGAIYLRGGKKDCSSFTSNEPEWLGFVLYKAVLKGQSNVFSPELANSSCGKFLTTDLKQWLLKAKGKNDYYKVKDLKANSPEFVSAISGCLNQFRNEYKNLVQIPAGKNGLLCGDCGTTLVSLYHHCFDNRISSDQVKFGKGGNVRFTVETATIKKDPAPYVSKLKFGDVLRLKGIGHYVMYTGGMGLPFEIIEMGGGGSADTAMSSGKLANSNAGTSPLDLSAMRAHTNAIGFFKGTPSSGSITAWGVLDNPTLNK